MFNSINELNKYIHDYAEDIFNHAVEEYPKEPEEIREYGYQLINDFCAGNENAIYPYKAWKLCELVRFNDSVWFDDVCDFALDYVDYDKGLDDIMCAYAYCILYKTMNEFFNDCLEEYEENLREEYM